MGSEAMTDKRERTELEEWLLKETHSLEEIYALGKVRELLPAHNAAIAREAGIEALREALLAIESGSLASTVLRRAREWAEMYDALGIHDGPCDRLTEAVRAYRIAVDAALASTAAPRQKEDSVMATKPELLKLSKIVGHCDRCGEPKYEGSVDMDLGVLTLHEFHRKDCPIFAFISIGTPYDRRTGGQREDG